MNEQIICPPAPWLHDRSVRELLPLAEAVERYGSLCAAGENAVHSDGAEARMYAEEASVLLGNIQGALRPQPLAPVPARGLVTWRDYTFEPDSESGVAVLCRSDDMCMDADVNDVGHYLDLGRAYDWARTHHARHIRAAIADEPFDDAHAQMGAAFKLGGTAAICDLKDPQASRLLLGWPENGQAVTVVWEDGTTLHAWSLGLGMKRLKESEGMGAADMVTLNLVVPDDPRRATVHFRETFAPVEGPEEKPQEEEGESDCSCRYDKLGESFPGALIYRRDPECPTHGDAAVEAYGQGVVSVVSAEGKVDLGADQCPRCHGYGGLHIYRDCEASA